MSEVTQEREMELVQGVIESVTKKKPDTWTIQVRPDGSQYTKNLWTKDEMLVAEMDAKLGQSGSFTCGISRYTRNDGQPGHSLWINSVQNGQTQPDASVSPSAAPAARAPQAKPSSEGLSKEDWRRKDMAADKRAYTAIAASSLAHTMPSDPSTEDLNKFMERVAHLTISWMKVQNALRDGEDVPFD